MKIFVLISMLVAITIADERDWSKTKIMKRIEAVVGEPSPAIVASDRIAFGDYVGSLTFEQQTFFSHQVRIESAITGQPGFINECGGSFIHKDFVLTAAHCLRGVSEDPDTGLDVHYETDYADMYFGIHNLAETRFPDTIKRRSLPNLFYIHNGWNPPQSRRDDMALIKLVLSVNEQPGFIDIIPLPSNTFCNGDFVGESGVISGWGLTETFQRTRDLKFGIVVARPNISCYVFGPAYDPLRNLCAVGFDLENTCEGDSGGPMVMADVDNQCVAGVTSFGSPNCSDGLPGVYSNVCFYMPWINGIINPEVRPPRKLFEFREYEKQI